ncbi:hypothetical protein [Kitasatospora azatica]|uniref:hypothetical protein n=1 Tax=Kitasatospora azatica TaxID=58347 RepID=UPI0005651F91
MPPFWRAIGAWLPNGAGTEVARSIAHFGGTDVTAPLLVLSAWAVAGFALALLAVVIRPRSGRPMAAAPGPEVELTRVQP